MKNITKKVNTKKINPNTGKSIDEFLFHQDVYMSEKVENKVFQLQKGLKDYKISKHLLNNINKVHDRSHHYATEEEIDNGMTCLFNGQEVKCFEIGVAHDYLRNRLFITKFCFRTKYQDVDDICIVVSPRYNFKYGNYSLKNATVVTAWINNSTDTHFTLDTERYFNKEDFNNEEIKFLY